MPPVKCRNIANILPPTALFYWYIGCKTLIIKKKIRHPMVQSYIFFSYYGQEAIIVKIYGIWDDFYHHFAREYH